MYHWLDRAVHATVASLDAVKQNHGRRLKAKS